MPFILGTLAVILLIVATALFARPKFSNLAVAKGYDGIRVKTYVWGIAGATFFLMLMGQTVLSFFANHLVLVLWSSFTWAMMITVLRRAYRNMLNAPHRDERVVENDSEIQ